MKTSEQRSILRHFKPLAGVAILLSCTLGSAAIAGPPARDAGVSTKLQASDLNVNTPAGAHTLYVRIRNAARSLCGLADATDAILHDQFVSCTDQAVADAVLALWRPELTKVYLATLDQKAATKFHARLALAPAPASDIYTAHKSR